jgi:hypothetical protein
VRTNVCIDGKLSGDVEVPLGVKQGCNASPSVFAAFINRLHEFMNQKLRDTTAAHKDLIFLAGICIHTILYADDIVLVSKTAQ